MPLFKKMEKKETIGNFVLERSNDTASLTSKEKKEQLDSGDVLWRIEQN